MPGRASVIGCAVDLRAAGERRPVSCVLILRAFGLARTARAQGARHGLELLRAACVVFSACAVGREVRAAGADGHGLTIQEYAVRCTRPRED